MRSLFVLVATVLPTVIATAADLTPKDLIAQLYQAHSSSHDPLVETQLLGRYFDAPLLKLYLRDKREAKGDVSRFRWKARPLPAHPLRVAFGELFAGETPESLGFFSFEPVLSEVEWMAFTSYGPHIFPRARRMVAAISCN